MAQYMNAILTDEGFKLLFKAINNNTKVNFTSLVSGAGYNFRRTKKETVNAIRKMKNLIDEKQRVEFKSVTTDENYAFLEVELSNKDYTGDGYEISELGLLATDGQTDNEILYAVILPESHYDTSIRDFIVNSDYMPPHVEGTADFEYAMSISVMISDGEGE